MTFVVSLSLHVRTHESTHIPSQGSPLLTQPTVYIILLVLIYKRAQESRGRRSHDLVCTRKHPAAQD